MSNTDIYRTKADQLQKAMDEKVLSAEQMREEIEEFKKGMEGRPDVDEPVAKAYEDALESGRDNAIQDISDMEKQIEKDRQDASDVVGDLNHQIEQNELATSKLESVRGNKYAVGVDAAISEAKANTTISDGIKKKLEQAAQEAAEKAAAAKTGI